MSDMAVNIALRQALKQGKFELKDKELQEKLQSAYWEKEISKKVALGFSGIMSAFIWIKFGLIDRLPFSKVLGRWGSICFISGFAYATCPGMRHYNDTLIEVTKKYRREIIEVFAPKKDQQIIMDIDLMETVLADMRQRQVLCVEEQNFSEALELENEINALKAKAGQANVLNLKKRQMKEWAMVNQRHQESIEQFNSHWNQVIQQKQRVFDQKQSKLRQKQQRQFTEYQSKLDNEISQIYKPSSYLLNIEWQQKKAAKLKNFAQAEEYRKKYNQIANQEQSEYEQRRSSKIQQSLSKLAAQQEREMQNLIQKHTLRINKLMQERDLQLETLIKKQQNQQRSLESAQTKEDNLILGKFKSCIDKQEIVGIQRILDTSTYIPPTEESKISYNH